MKYKSSNYNVFLPLEGNNTFIVHNTLSNALAEANEKDYRIITEMINYPDIDPAELVESEFKIFESLLKGRFIIPSEDNELSILKLRNMVCRFNSSHLELEIIPTLSCNFKCVYCYETRKKQIMSSETQSHLINWIGKEINHLETLHVSWFGGEPLLAFDVVKNLSREFVKICKENNAKYTASMPTNGYLLNEKIASELLEMNFINIQFTLDGDEKSHNRFRPLINGRDTFQVILINLINLARMNTNISISLRVNFNRENYNFIPNLFDKIPAEIRPKIKIYFRNIFPHPEKWQNETTICGRFACTLKKQKIESSSAFSSDREYAKMATELNRIALEKGFQISGNSQLSFSPPYYCQVDLQNHYVLTPDGNLFKCPVEFELDKKVGYFDKQGNLRLDISRIAKWSDKDAFEDDECKSCKILPLCMGGCQFHIINGKKQCPTQRYDFENRLKLQFQEKKLQTMNKIL